MEQLAIETLYNNSENGLVLLAGSTIYNDLWTRDSFLGALGLLSKKMNNTDKTIVKTLLTLLTQYQGENGLITLRIGKTWYQQFYDMMYFKKHHERPSIDREPNPIYRDDKMGSFPTDSNPQYIILAYLYLKETNDSDFIKSILNNIVRAHHYIKTKDKLIHGHYFNSWYDTFTINGPDLFTNVLYGYSLKCYEALLNKFNLSPHKKFNGFLKSFKKHFMVSTKDSLYFKIHPDIDSLEIASNSFIVLFDFFSKKENEKIIRTIEKKTQSPIKNVTYPKLSYKYIYKPAFLINMQGYHNDNIWLWVNFIYYAAFKKTFKSKNIAQSAMDLFEKSIQKYNTFYECVDRDLNPVSTLFQNSEKNFTCSCGTFLLYHSKKKLFEIV